MTEDLVPAIGVVVSGVALALLLDFSSSSRIIGTMFAVLALGAFLGRRYQRLDRPVGDGIAVSSGIGILVAATWWLIDSFSAIEPFVAGLAPIGAILCGVGIAILGAIDYRSLSPSTLRSMLKDTIAAVAIGVTGLLGIYLWGAVIVSVLGLAGTSELTTRSGVILSTVAGGFGTATVAFLVLYWSDREWTYLDVSFPTIRELAIVVVATGAIIGFNVIINIVFQTLGLESTTHQLVQVSRTDPTILLWLIPLAYLLIGPGEELLYRNIVQKSLYSSFSRPGAILLASAIFAVVHLPAFADPTAGPLPLLNTLTKVFLLSLILGITYHRTNNVVVAALVHGSFDAVAFAITYIQLTG